MAKINWVFQDEIGTNLNRYKATNVSTGEVITFDLLRSGNISVIGTPLNAEKLNSLITAINENYNDIIALKNRATNIENNISNLQNATTTNTNNISANRNDINTNTNKITNLESTKANKNEVQQALDEKANKDEVQQALDQKANKDEVQQALDEKANKSEIGEIPSIEGLASENYVNNYVNGAIDDFYTNEIDGSYLSTSGGVVNGNITANNYTAKQSVCTKWVQCGGYMQYGTAPTTSPSTKGALYFDEAGTIHYFKNAIVEGKTSNNELATVEYVDNKHLYEHNIEIYYNSDNTITPPSNKEIIRVFFKIYLTTNTLITANTVRDYIDTNPISATGFRYTYTAQTQNKNTTSIVSIKDNTIVGGYSLIIGAIYTTEVSYSAIPIGIAGSTLTDAVKQIY